MERMTVVTSSKLKAMFQGRMNGSGVRCHIFGMRVRRLRGLSWLPERGEQLLRHANIVRRISEEIRDFTKKNGSVWGKHVL